MSHWIAKKKKRNWIKARIKICSNYDNWLEVIKRKTMKRKAACRPLSALVRRGLYFSISSSSFRQISGRIEFQKRYLRTFRTFRLLAKKSSIFNLDLSTTFFHHFSLRFLNLFGEAKVFAAHSPLPRSGIPWARRMRIILLTMRTMPGSFLSLSSCFVARKMRRGFLFVHLISVFKLTFFTVPFDFRIGFLVTVTHKAAIAMLLNWHSGFCALWRSPRPRIMQFVSEVRQMKRSINCFSATADRAWAERKSFVGWPNGWFVGCKINEKPSTVRKLSLFHVSSCFQMNSSFGEMHGARFDVEQNKFKLIWHCVEKYASQDDMKNDISWADVSCRSLQQIFMLSPLHPTDRCL